MPDKSCRTCGGELIKWSTCSDCRKVTQKICRICCEKTIEEFHSHQIHLAPYNLANMQGTLATVQSYQDPADVKNPRKKHNKKHGKAILAICCIVSGIIILGISTMNYFEYLHNFSPPQVQSISSPNSPPENLSISQPASERAHIDTLRPSEEAKHTYNNCLGVSNGMQLTVTCPTEYGTTYKAVVKIPSELIAQLESNVFNLRELSVTEHVDSISIQYAKKMYEAKFVNS
jgi:hypothetical protein